MGYKFVPAPEGYPGKVYEWGHRALEHHVVWWKHTGQVVPPKFVLHHKNEDKSDNRVENLELKAWSAHTTEHHTKTTLTEKFVCCRCGVEKDRSSRDVRFKRSIGQNLFCSSSCAALWGHEQ